MDSETGDVGEERSGGFLGATKERTSNAGVFPLATEDGGRESEVPGRLSRGLEGPFRPSQEGVRPSLGVTLEERGHNGQSVLYHITDHKSLSNLRKLEEMMMAPKPNEPLGNETTQRIFLEPDPEATGEYGQETIIVLPPPSNPNPNPSPNHQQHQRLSIGPKSSPNSNSNPSPSPNTNPNMGQGLSGELSSNSSPRSKPHAKDPNPNPNANANATDAVGASAPLLEEEKEVGREFKPSMLVYGENQQDSDGPRIENLQQVWCEGVWCRSIEC